MKVSYKGRRRKGAELEYLIRDKLIESGIDPNAHRTFMSGGTWLHKGDIYSKALPIHWEAKNQETSAPYQWYEQALRDRPTARLTPVVVHKRNRNPAMVFISLDDFIEILKYAQDGGFGKE